MSSSSDIKTLMENVGHCSYLVNNAGVQHVCPIESFPAEKWDAVIAINLTAAFHTTKAVLPTMRETNFGRIINIASVHGLIGSANKSAYVAAKHGIIGLTKTVALETATTGVTVNAICPGWVLTNMVQAQVDEIASRNNLSDEEAKLQLLGEKQPSGKFVTTDQLSSMAMFLSSDDASEVRGTSFQMDGGWTAQ
jgi:3-hydroxybutyrate dehydrogenase